MFPAGFILDTSVMKMRNDMIQHSSRISRDVCLSSQAESKAAGHMIEICLARMMAVDCDVNVESKLTCRSVAWRCSIRQHEYV